MENCFSVVDFVDLVLRGEHVVDAAPAAAVPVFIDAARMCVVDIEAIDSLPPGKCVARAVAVIGTSRRVPGRTWSMPAVGSGVCIRGNARGKHDGIVVAHLPADLDPAGINAKVAEALALSRKAWTKKWSTSSADRVLVLREDGRVVVADTILGEGKATAAAILHAHTTSGTLREMAAALL